MIYSHYHIGNRNDHYAQSHRLVYPFLPTPAPDLDLTKGAHFSINLAEPNTLQRRLEGAVFQTDYDMVDFLTVKGKFGGKDLVYLRAQEGLVSQLQYLVSR